MSELIEGQHCELHKFSKLSIDTLLATYSELLNSLMSMVINVVVYVV